MSKRGYRVRLSLPITAETTEAAVEMYVERVKKGGEWTVSAFDDNDERLGMHTVTFPPNISTPLTCPACEESKYVDLNGDALLVEGFLQVPLICDGCMHRWTERR